MIPLFSADRKTIEAQGAVKLSNPVKTIQMLRFAGSPHLITGEIIPKGESVSLFYRREDTPNGLICYVREKMKEDDEKSDHSPAYWEGFAEALWSYAHWKDGTQYVGNMGTKLADAYEKAGVPKEYRKGIYNIPKEVRRNSESN